MRSNNPHQLPLQPPVVIGRAAERALLTGALDQDDAASSVLVVEGAAGTGKSTLALDWAYRQLARFPDGQLYADLGGFDRFHAPAAALSVLQAFLGAMGVAPEAVPADEQAVASLYRSVLAGRRMLVLLDNAADAAQVTPLLPGSPSCVVLVTSRHSLGALRLRGATVLRLDVLSPDQARALLVHQLGPARVQADPTAVDEVLACSGGLPLAVALVAARLTSQPDLPISGIVDELRDAERRLDVFEIGDGSPGLRTVLSWSYRGLGVDAAAGFRLLGAAPVRELSVVAAASLLALDTHKAASLLRSLRSKNLIQLHRGRRYRMHDLVRLYARELLSKKDDATEVTAATRRLVDFYLHTAHRADRLLYPHRSHVEPPAPVAGSVPLRFSGETSALDWFVNEQPQLLAMLRAKVDHEWPAHAWHISRALDTYQYRRGWIHDNVETSRIGAAAAERLGSRRIRALAQRQLGRAFTRTGDYERAIECLDVALGLVHGPVEQAHTHHDLARVLALRGDGGGSMRHALQALELYRAGDNAVGAAHAMNAVARRYVEQRDYDSARRYAAAALALHEQHGNPSGAAVALDNLGLIAQLAGQPVEAERCYTRALVLSRHQDNSYFEADVTERLADAQWSTGRIHDATRSLAKAHQLYVAQHRLADAERLRKRLHIT